MVLPYVNCLCNWKKKYPWFIGPLLLNSITFFFCYECDRQNWSVPISFGIYKFLLVSACLSQQNLPYYRQSRCSNLRLDFRAHLFLRGSYRLSKWRGVYKLLYYSKNIRKISPVVSFGFSKTVFHGTSFKLHFSFCLFFGSLFWK